MTMMSILAAGSVKSRVTLNFTYSANTANASLNLSSLSGYEAGFSDITVTVNSGIYVYSTAVGNAGLTFTGGTTGDTLTLVNNGFIMGMGGYGGAQRNSLFFWSGGPGGNAIQLSIDTTINNTNASAYIGGGGGGGGAGNMGSGGGAGGGEGGRWDQSGLFAAGGSGGAIGASGGNGTIASYFDCCGQLRYVSSGGGGGRVFPGVGGASVSGNTGGRGGTGGGGGGAVSGSPASGAGGSANAVGGNGASAGAGGGGWGASGGGADFAGGASGGKAVNLNGKAVTWTSGNTTRVYGAVS